MLDSVWCRKIVWSLAHPCKINGYRDFVSVCIILSQIWFSGHPKIVSSLGEPRSKWEKKSISYFENCEYFCINLYYLKYKYCICLKQNKNS